MNVIILLFLVPLAFSVAFTDKYNALPSVYQLEDFVGCLEKGDLYCKTDAMLRNTGYENNTLWALINDSIRDKYRLDRNLIHRGICVPKNETSLNSIKKFAGLHINEELKKANLSSSIEDITCNFKNDVKISFKEKIFCCGLLAYLLFILYATVHDVPKKTGESNAESIGNKIMTSFSLASNWKKICNTTGNEDYSKLKSIQGIRACTMVTIVWIHSIISVNLIYISNPEELEKASAFSLVTITYRFCFFVVQTFFLISSWLTTIQIYNFYREHGNFTLKHVLVMFINRFVRLAVCSTVVISLLTLSCIRLVNGPITFDNISLVQKGCHSNWWQTFFFVNNYLPLEDICHLSSWYLSADFQMYVLTLITIYVILKFNWSEWKVISFLFLVSCVLFGSMIYMYKTDASIKLGINETRKYNFFRFPQARVLYFSTYSCWTTSIVGISFGLIYVENKNRKIINTNVLSALCALLFLGLPTLAMFIASYDFAGIAAAIVGPLLKPLFATGIAVGILGMSHNIGGILKRVLENDYFAIMSNFSYSVYIFQTLVLFTKGVGSDSLIEINMPQLVAHILFFDIPMSIAVGIVGALLFEQPGINLQKILLPQLPRGTQQSQKNK